MNEDYEEKQLLVRHSGETKETVVNVEGTAKTFRYFAIDVHVTAHVAGLKARSKEGKRT
jgi:hypothetical protein